MSSLRGHTPSFAIHTMPVRVLLILATPLMLGSSYGLAASAILAGALVFRIIMEERELGRNLEGYAEYTRRVRYRLAPLIW